jgi:acetyl esterase/lipase
MMGLHRVAAVLLAAVWIPAAGAETKKLADVEYSRVGERVLRLDLYLPAGARGPVPVIVSIHGGGWHGGSKEASPGLDFAERGFAVASVEYRLTGEAEFPAQMDDCRAAIVWLRANAAHYGLDGNRMAAWGASAGGHLAALLGTSGRGEGRLQAVVDYFGPIDVVEWTRSRGAAGSNLIRGPLQQTAERLRAANPLTWLSPEAPPFFIAHGDQDRLVPVEQSRILYEALRRAGVAAEFHLVPGGGHSVPRLFLDDDVERFLRRTLAP